MVEFRKDRHIAVTGEIQPFIQLGFLGVKK